MPLSKFIDIKPRNVLSFDIQTRILGSLRVYDNMYGNLQYLLKMCDPDAILFNAINCNIVEINEYMLFVRIEKWYYILTYNVPHIANIKSFIDKKISKAIIQKKFEACQIIHDEKSLNNLDEQLKVFIRLPNTSGFGFVDNKNNIIIYAIDACTLFYFSNDKKIMSIFIY